MHDSNPSPKRLPIPFSLFMVLTCAIWCGIWIVVAQVTWKVLIFHAYRLDIFGSSVFFIAIGGVLMYIAVDQVGRGLREHWHNHLRRQVERENAYSVASPPNPVGANGN